MIRLPRSLRARLLVSVVALTTAGLAVLGAVVYAQQYDFLMARADEQTRTAAPAIAAALSDAGVDDPGMPQVPGDGRGPYAVEGGGRGRGGVARDGVVPSPDERGAGAGGPPSLRLTPGVWGARVAGDGEVLGSVALTYGEAAPSPPALPAALPADGELVTVPSRDGSLEYRLSARTFPGAETTTVVAVPLSDVQDQLSRLLLVLAAVIASVLVVLVAVGSWLVRRSLRPLDRIGDTAGRIAAGDYSERVAPDDPTTEVGRLGRSLNGMLDQIEDSFAQREASEHRLRQFLSDASHELRTPLASIRGYAELHRMGAAGDPAESARAIGRIEQEAARMGVLVEDLLALARLDEVRETVREPVDLAELARDAVADAHATAPERDVTLSAEGDDTVVLGDEGQLRQVIGNLVRNALVHTPDGTPIEIAVGGERGGPVELVVRDHGPGLPVDDGAELFERFWRADPARTRGAAGAGLGLAIVHAVVTAGGGSVHAANADDGDGAVFTVKLPSA